jgi:hypothetical protein
MTVSIRFSNVDQGKGEEGERRKGKGDLLIDSANWPGSDFEAVLE